MKKALAIIVFFSLMTQCMLQLGIIGYYQLNRAYIAKNLCENRNRPELKCCGKCYLKKQLKKADGENSNSKNLPNKIDKNESVTFLLPAPIHFTKYNSTDVAIHHSLMQHMHGADIALAIFHPPSVSC